MAAGAKYDGQPFGHSDKENSTCVSSTAEMRKLSNVSKYEIKQMRKSLDRKINRDEDFDKYEDDDYFSGDLKEEHYEDE